MFSLPAKIENSPVKLELPKGKRKVPAAESDEAIPAKPARSKVRPVGSSKPQLNNPTEKLGYGKYEKLC